MSETAQANDGARLQLDSLPQQFEYDGTFVSTITVNYQGKFYVQTFLNDGTNITFISGWQVQPDVPPAQLMLDKYGNVMVDNTGDTMVTS